MGYWGDVHRRAFHETRELVRLDQPGRALVTLTGIAVPAVAGFMLAHNLDPLAKGLAALGALAGAGLLIYAWKLLSLPKTMAAEEALRLAAAQAELDELAQRPDYKAIRLALAEYASQAAPLLQPIRDGDENVDEAPLRAWADAVIAYLREQLDESYVHRFLDSSGYTTFVAAASGKQSDALTWINRRKWRLAEFIKEFSPTVPP